MKYNTPAVDVFMRMSSSYRLLYEDTSDIKHKSISVNYNKPRSPDQPKRKLLTIKTEHFRTKEKHIILIYPSNTCKETRSCTCRKHIIKQQYNKITYIK
jgi:hypothetical protein